MRPFVPVAVVLAVVACPGAAGAQQDLAGAGPARRLAPIFRPDRAAAPPGAHLSYFGGRVLSRVELVMVRWGTGAYAPYVTGTGSPSLPRFLEGLAGSAYVLGLAEYDTARPAVDGAPGTGQHIGAGTFGGAVQIAPSTAADQLTDAVIAGELAAQLEHGTLPPPRAAADGGFETLYLVYFPAGKRISLGSDESCRSFCAYHGSFPWRGWSVAYAVMPDLSEGSGCDLGCGNASPFANAASVASHEIAEAITDPDVAGATGAGPPLAWYDPLDGEIGDLCVGETGTVSGTDGARWPVQRLWSNARGACVVPVAPAPLVAAAPAPESATPPATPRGVDAVAPAAPIAPRAALAVQPIPAMRLARAPEETASAPDLGAARETFPALRSPALPGRALRVELREDNDAFGLTRPVTDEFYTQGFRLAVQWSLGPGGAGAEGEQLQIAIGQNIYTPSNLRTTDLSLLRNDRPYAGWLYVSATLRSLGTSLDSIRLGFDRAAGAATETEAELTAGVTGRWSFASDLQHDAHAYLDQRAGVLNPSPPDPAGWQVYQLDTHPTFDFSFRHQRDVLQISGRLGAFTGRTGSALGLRVAPRVRFDVGSTTDAASLGLEARAGIVGASGPTWRPAFPFRLYAYGRADGRYVLWNEFIEGPLRDGVVSLVRLVPWVGQLEAGVVLRLGHLELTASQLYLTREFLPVPAGTPPLHDVGRFTAAWVTP